MNVLDPEIRRRLSNVNRDRDLERDADACTPSVQPRTAMFHDLFLGREVTNELGTLFVYERSPEDLHLGRYETLADSIGDLRAFGCLPEEAIFLDIETCGLANCPVFLVGTMFLKDGRVCIEQLFARDYSEEVSLLLHVADSVSRFSSLVTFNGRTFDVPYIRDRMNFYRMPYDFSQVHLDLLPKARLKWRDCLPNCRLQTLEKHVCGRRRYGDTPGHLIPQIYHDFVRTGNAAPLEGVFYHNALDLITMAELLPRLLAPD